jgi:hypothetical protein
MTTFEKMSSRYPRLKQYLECKELAIKELLNDRFSILNRRDHHLQIIQKQLDGNKEFLLLLGHVVDESCEGPVYFVESEKDGDPI